MSSPKRISFDPMKYAGRLDDVIDLENFMRLDFSPERIPIVPLFLVRYRNYPCTAVIEALPRSAKLHLSTIRRYLETDHKHNPLDDIVQRQYHSRTRSLYITDFLADLGNGIMIDCDQCQLIDDIDNPNKYRSDGPTGHFLITDKIRIYYLPQHENLVVGDLASKLSLFYVFPSQSRTMQVLLKNSQENYSFTRITIKKPIIYDLELNYGLNFLKFHDHLIKTFLHTEWRGIVILHGYEGTGKTYYLRYLINELDKLRLICIPVDLLKVDLSELASLLRNPSNAILIIDDAESLNKENPTLVLNKLFQLHQLHGQSIIAVFNYPLQSILSNLKTSKLIEQSFNKLNPSDAEILFQTLGFPRPANSMKQPLTLNEIYRQRNIDHRRSNPDPVLQNLVEHEFTLSEKGNCLLS